MSLGRLAPDGAIRVEDTERVLVTSPRVAHRSEFVPLDRRVMDFKDLGEEDPEVLVAHSLVRDHWGLPSHLMTLDQLVERARHAVVLGEPGAGKTWELEALVERLRATGQPAAFVPMETALEQPSLAVQGVQSTAGYLLLVLDALDESRLKSTRALEHCLVAVARELGERWPRTRVVISCRVSEWRAYADLQILDRLLPPDPAAGNRSPSRIVDEGESDEQNEEEEDDDRDEGGCPAEATHQDGAEADRRSAQTKQPHLRVVCLAPLTKEQISRLARARAVKDPDAFMKALAESGAQDLCSRPSDVVDLVGYWNDHRRLGRLAEVLEANVTRKVKQPDQRVEPALSPDEARAAAEDLAAAVVLGRTRSLLAPDEIVDPAQRTNAIDPADALPGWDEGKIRTLLSRPVFDEATLGRVRFHHRSVSEYLAARWFQRLLRSGCPASRIERIFASEVFGREVLHPATAPIAAWLALWDSRFAGLVMRLEPAALIHHGDPQSLPLPTRERLLRAFAEHYRDRGRVPFADWSQLARLASADLAPTILALLSENPKNDLLRFELMRLAVAGRLGACGDVALQFALDGSVDSWVRVQSIDLVAELGHPPHVAELGRYLETAETIDRRVLYRLWGVLFPRHIAVGPLLNSVQQRLSDVAEDLTSDSGSALQGLVAHCPSSSLPELLTGLTERARAAGSGPPRAWLLDGLCLTLLRVLKEISVPAPIEPVINAIGLIDEIERNDSRTRFEMSEASTLGKIREASRAHQELRRAAMWRHHQGETRLRPWLLGVLGILPGDLDWLLRDLADRVAPNREVALSATLALVKVPSRDFDRVRDAVADSSELLARLEQLTSPSSVPESPHERLMRERQARERAQLQTNRDQLLGRLEVIRTGEDTQAFIYLVDRYAGVSRGDRFNWKRLEEEMGPEIAAAARAGLASWWQSVDVATRAESQGGVPHAVMLGQVGLKLFFERAGSRPTLTPTLARRAARFAVWELNRLPAWLGAVSLEQPDAVREVLLSAIRSDLSGTDDHALLGQVAVGPPEVLSLVAPHVVSLLSETGADAKFSLRSALRIALARPEDHARVAALAAVRAPASLGRESHLLWVVAWLAVDAAPALDFLEAHVRQLGTEAGEHYLTDLLFLMGRGELSIGTEGSLLGPAPLTRFVLLTYAYLNPAHDERREGPHNTTRKEEAQRARSGYLQVLGAQDSDEAYRALTDIRAGGQITERSTLEWIDEMIVGIAQRVAQGPAWPPSRVVELVRRHESSPRTSGDLFRVVLDRLEAIVADLQRGELSSRDFFRPDHKEVVVQKWLADELRRAAAGLYTVHREEQVDLDKETDVRVHSPHVEGPVCVEVKRANHYSFTELVDALRTQLVGKYLRDRRARYGVLFLANLDPDRRWEPGPGESLTFQQVVERLEALARELLGTTAGVEGLRVVGVELIAPAPPSTPMSASALEVARCRRCGSTDEVSDMLMTDGSRQFRCAVCRAT